MDKATITGKTKNDVLFNVKRLSTGERYTVFSNGIVSSIDILTALIRNLGFRSIEIMIVTWQLGIRDQVTLSNITRNPRIKMRILLDISYVDRNKDYFDTIRRTLGPVIWLTSTHAKVMVLKTADKNFTVLSSANFNRNRRFEFFDITESRELLELVMKNFEPFFTDSPINEKSIVRRDILKKFDSYFEKVKL